MITILFLTNVFSLTLQEAFDNAPSQGEYDKYIVLESNSIYTGGLGIYEGNIYINCNGSIIDLEEGNGIWIYADENYPSSLEIEYCTIINSLYYGLSYGGISEGTVKNCNLINTNFGIKLFDESNVNLINSIFASNYSLGIGVYTELPTLSTSYCLFWDNEDDCMENCPGWGSIWTQLELTPGTGIIYEDPLFINDTTWDFSLQNSSPCINSGSPDFLDSDGTISDIGAMQINNSCSYLGDLNNDGVINVLDITLGICFILDSSDSMCSLYCEMDMNGDNEYNVVDIILIINIIINL